VSRSQTPHEQALWHQLRGKRFANCKFRRQQPLGPYIVDFVCFNKRLIIELDGSQHADQQDYDAARDSWLQSHGFRVLRFWNNQWQTQPEAVLDAVYEMLQQKPPLPNPSPARGEGLETGAQLLERILTERRARWEAKQLAKFEEQGKKPPKDWQKKYPEPVQPDATGLPALPEGWVWSSLGECFQVAVGATPSRKEVGYWNGAIPWVSSGEVRFNRIKDTKEKITDAGLSNSSTQINPVGSVLLGMIGEGKTRGQVAILDIPAANNQNCAAIWVSESGVPPEFVYCWLWSQYEQTRRGSSGNNQPALNKSIVERISMPLPPLAEMQEIVRVVDATMEQIASQEEAVAQSLKQSTAQRQNILRAAFSGQLVPQDPTDEPASVLLERIRAERAAQSAMKRLSRKIPKV
jgi:type I restriction enzyme, S subunit